MKKTVLSFATILSMVTAAHSVSFPTPSNYGTIQNVQNYSMHPYWNVDSSYNMRMVPQVIPVYGPDLSGTDCTNVITAFLPVVCATKNNCIGMNANDVKADIMVQLSQLKDNNYVTSCLGFIDSAFDSYIKNNTNNVMPTSFPTGTNYQEFPSANTPSIDSGLPVWKQEELKREAELKNLQSKTAIDTSLKKNSMPGTIDDVEFGDRMANLKAGYEPYKDAKIYHEIDVVYSDNSNYNTKQCKSDTDCPCPAGSLESFGKCVNGYCDFSQCGTYIPPVLENTPDGFSDLSTPFYGILVVQSGSLDEVLQQEDPVISSNFLAANKHHYFPHNSDSFLGGALGKCTHGAHTAHDKDIVNMAAHIAQNEKDSWWSGNDYYVFDGSEMYWGVATITMDIALTVATFGASAAAQGALKGAQAAQAAKAISSGTKATDMSNDIRRALRVRGTTIDDVAKNFKLTTEQVKVLASTNSVDKIKDSLNTAKASAPDWKEILTLKPKLGRFFGTSKLNPTVASTRYANASTDAIQLSQKAMNRWQKTLNKTLGTLSTITPAATASAPWIVGFFNDMYDVSFANTDIYTDGAEFNSFGLLSADDLNNDYINPDGTSQIAGYTGGDLTNIASHGMWLKWDGSATDAEADVDAMIDALEFAEKFGLAMNNVNSREHNEGRPADRLCDVDVFIVRSLMKKNDNGKNEVYYLIMNDTPLSVPLSGGEKAQQTLKQMEISAQQTNKEIGNAYNTILLMK